MMLRLIGILVWSLFVLILLAYAFYFEGSSVKPHDYDIGDTLGVRVNKLSSTKTQLRYDYYSLRYCRPAHMKDSFRNMGEILRGDKIQNSIYKFRTKVNEACKVACAIQLDAAEANNFKEKIDDGYRVNMFLDQLPVAMLWEKRGGSQQKFYELGFPIGFRGNKTASNDVKYFINNHLSFKVRYHKDPKTDSARIVGFEVTPYSIHHDHSPWFESVTCLPETKGINMHANTVPQEIKAGSIVVFTYDVSFQSSEVEWASRWDMYFAETKLEKSSW